MYSCRGMSRNICRVRNRGPSFDHRRNQPRLKSWRGPHVGWTSVPFLFFIRPFSVFRYCSTHACFKRSLPTYFFPSLLKFSKEVLGSTVGFPQCPAKKNESRLQKLDGTKYTWSPLSPKLDGTRRTRVDHESLFSGPDPTRCVGNPTRPDPHL